MTTNVDNLIAQSETASRKTRRDEYRGNPLICIPMGENREVSFGVGKARAILAYLDDIREFVAESEPKA
jgi:hypothetical protein